MLIGFGERVAQLRMTTTMTRIAQSSSYKIHPHRRNGKIDAAVVGGGGGGYPSYL